CAARHHGGCTLPHHESSLHAEMAAALAAADNVEAFFRSRRGNFAHAMGSNLRALNGLAFLATRVSKQMRGSFRHPILQAAAARSVSWPIAMAAGLVNMAR